jgi:hypothetical protein
VSEVTRILSAIEGGDPHAAELLLPLVYDELRKVAAQRLAQEKPGQALTALPQFTTGPTAGRLGRTFAQGWPGQPPRRPPARSSWNGCPSPGRLES